MKKISLDLRPKKYYHLTQSNKLKSLIVALNPKGSGENRPCEEPNIFRICVAPTISGCISAGVFYPTRDIRIYSTTIKAWTTFDVKDAKITGEKWILESCYFKLEGTIPKKIIKEFYDGSNSMEQRERFLKENKKILEKYKSVICKCRINKKFEYKI
ncbi:hypothetical protein M0P65_05340 [Candidatus Gracilibacteria bacterium]|nr:hypothetical protein [Candidatus Gracilibacteria bacterium]